VTRYALRAGLVLLDLGCLLAAFWLGWWTRFHILPPLLPGLVSVEQPWSLYLDLLAPVAVLLVIFAGRARLYRFHDLDLRRQVYGSLQVVAWLLPVVAAYLVIFHQSYEFSRLGTLFALGWLTLLLPLARVLAFQVAGRAGLLRVNTLFIGSAPRVEAFLEAVGRRRYARRNRLLGRFSPDELFDATGEDFVAERNAQVDRMVDTEGLQKVVVFMEGLPRRRLTTVLRKFEIRVKTIKLVPDAATMALMGARITRLDAQPLLGLEQSLWRPAKRLIKRALDVAAGLAALPVVLALVALATPFLGWRPLMRIRRFDLARRPLTLLQLRVDYEAGGWLFQSGLYKLPELLGVLAGRQSLVGPAPLIERELDLYHDNPESFARVRPGLTGLWQVSDYGYFEPGQRQALDLYYAMNWSPQLDARILLESLLKGWQSLRHPRAGALRT
jgi:lipopolysaccharide/colanic/teichoic acid biosynthesis glycosyltransferase